MKLRALFAGMGLFVAAVTFAQTAAPPMPKPSSAVPAPPPTTDAAQDTSVTKAAPPPAKKDATKSTVTKKAPPAKKKEEPPATIEGVTVTRGKGGFLGLQVVNNNFVLSFYDAKKKKIAPDVARAGLRWPVKYQPGPERAVLNPSGGALTSGKTVKPPLNFKVFISLFVEGSEEPVENFTVDFHE